MNSQTLQMAIEEFQADHGIPITGERDDATVAAVEQSHDVDARPWRDRNWIEVPDVSDGGPSKKGIAT